MNLFSSESIENFNGIIHLSNIFLVTSTELNGIIKKVYTALFLNRIKSADSHHPPSQQENEKPGDQRPKEK